MMTPIARKLSWANLRLYIGGFGHWGDHAFTRAMLEAGFERRVQPRRIRLTVEHRQTRLAFAREQWALRPRPEDWEVVLFSDETWATNNPIWKRWLTIHDSKDIEDWTTIRQKPHGWMFWSMICGSENAGSFVWEKEYGGINSEKYQRYIVPIINGYITRKREQGTSIVFQQDNASPHSSRATRAYIRSLGIELLTWPARSPDFNPIENVWFWMKDWLELHYNIQLLNKAALRRAILEAWEAVPSEYVLGLIHSMPRRLEKCIALEGQLTGY
ncbi:hypothetical protein QC761_0074400 [Podospora bellae-mahoneyi]|uniref:Tc1-like transposase DDE domain-containing protein n=1 Tax=Podospora bellae-mahoneyi TaxID=2093777 RepID=A0ABR0FEY2_9PEZI|nr:hypothetical protein QC761_0074400 [Podospora bellae-mahoneyi]